MGSLLQNDGFMPGDGERGVIRGFVNAKGSDLGVRVGVADAQLGDATSVSPSVCSELPWLQCHCHIQPSTGTTINSA